MNRLIDFVEPLQNEEDRANVSVEASRLLASLSHHPEVAALGTIQEAAPPSNLPALAAIGEKIRKEHLIEACPFAAMVASPAPEKHPSRYQHDILRGWMVAAVLGLNDNSAHEVIAGCRRVRLAQRNVEAWLMKIIDQLDIATSLSELVKWLETERKKLGDGTPEELSQERLVAALHVPLRNFLAQRPPIRRRSGTNTPTVTDSVFVARPLTDSTDSGNVQELIVISDDVAAEDKSEGTFDRPTSKRHYDVRLHTPGAHRQHLAMQTKRARELARALSVQSLLLPCDYSGLTKYEATSLLRETFHPPTNGEFADLALCLSLCLGLEIAEMPNMRFITDPATTNSDAWFERNGVVFLVRRPDLPNHEKESTAPLLLSGRYGGLMLTLPTALATPRTIRTLYNKDDLKNKAESRLKDINRRQHLRLTLGRIFNHLHTSLVQKGEDRARSALIGGKPGKAYPQIYYHTDETIRVQNVHSTWLHDLIAKAHLDVGNSPPSPHTPNLWVGSNLAPNPEMLQLYTGKLHKRLNYQRRSGSNGLVPFHNEFILYSLQLLNLATGHRPVVCPYQSLLDIDTTSRAIWISDKEIRSGFASRVIPLPDIAIAQIEHIRNQLRSLIDHVSVVGTEAADFATKALAGTGPFLFFISEESDAIEIPRPANLREKLKNHWTLPLNWPRHWVRSSLSRRGFPGELVDGWMGHADFGQEALGQWSGLSFLDFRKVALEVNNLMRQIGFEEVPGWPRRST